VVVESDAADPSVSSVYVAGATGRTGQRVVRELVETGMAVRAGVRSQEKFEETFKPLLQDGEKGKRLTCERASLEDASTLNRGVSGADVVVCCLGAPEDEFKLDNPKRIDGDGTIALIDAAKASGTVKHFVLVTSLGTGRFGWPASILNLFFGVLYHKRRAEDHLIRSGLEYTIVRPGGMERPGDDYYKENKMVVKPQDTQFGGQVSRTQVSWCVRECVLNRQVSANKVLEVVTAERAEMKKKRKDDEAPEFVEYDVSVLGDISKISAAGDATIEGTPDWYTSRYAYEPTKLATLARTMGFRGSAPEAVNGRLAMLGLVASLGEEAVNAKPIAQQIADQYLGVALVFALVTSSSLVPLIKGVEIKHADLGPFRAAAERLNGRLAMLAFTYLAGQEVLGSTDGGDTRLAIDVAKDSIAKVAGAVTSLDGKGALFAAGVAVLLGGTTALATLAPFQLLLSGGNDEDDE